ncbi:MAG: inorganic phosphate transporter [Sphaerochaetaceae bacterium]
MMYLFFLTALFMGWSLGANDAANVFGAAVGTKMISFRSAALVSSVCVIAGAVLLGEGSSEGLNSLGNIDSLLAASIVLLSAGITVMLMTRLGLPVSTSQAIIGAIVASNLFFHEPLHLESVSKIALTWVYSPLLAFLISFALYAAIRWILNHMRIHLLMIDHYNRILLFIAGAAGAFALGANNIANVVGLFIFPFEKAQVTLLPFFPRLSTQLFFIGSLAIGAGIITFSKRVMITMGNSLFELSAVSAFVVVISSALVLLLFSSQSLSQFLQHRGLPSFPLIPVSQSQSSVGAVLGIAAARKGWHSIRRGLLLKIAAGWVATPLGAALITYVSFSFLSLFIDL